ncbi:CLUMA_CG000365, isoform A [Clunio marinus]|uniref:CLUMA_CG000365, isoform A n=1 Tax=Clunio marinus TaxID=568069 RepID=A0A1J1HG59_9DIPT|nr:CLUMA_CG000365, isoform A [Clunio marinus]
MTFQFPPTQHREQIKRFSIAIKLVLPDKHSIEDKATINNVINNFMAYGQPLKLTEWVENEKLSEQKSDQFEHNDCCHEMEKGARAWMDEEGLKEERELRQNEKRYVDKEIRKETELYSCKHIYFWDIKMLSFSSMNV